MATSSAPFTGGTPDDLLMRLAQQVQDELNVDAPLLARSLFGEHAPGTVQMGDEQITGLIQRNKQSPQFLQRLAVAVGPDKFRELAAAAGLPVPSTGPSLLAQAGGGADGNVPNGKVPDNSDNPSLDETTEITR